MDLVLIRPGSFTMGDDDHKPTHKVNITKPLYIGKYEVTQEQWQAIMGSNPSSFKGPKNPVDNVSWEECQEFCAKMKKWYRGEFSLPTEAQWEYACRAGTTTKYTFGEEDSGLGDYAWFTANSDSKTQPVGQKKPNAWGLYDVHGNVWEWCGDWYGSDYYEKSPADDPIGPSSGSGRVVRGGGWSYLASFCRSAYRYYGAPAGRDYSGGFRVACVR